MSTGTTLTRLSRYGEPRPAPLHHGHAYSYSVTIESAAKYKQRPETMDSIKRAFRSIFRRSSKRSKSNQAQQQSATTSRRQPQTQSPAPTTSGSTPPPAPPKGTPRAVEPTTTAHLPPGYPLATRRQDDGALQGRGVQSGSLVSREPGSGRVSREEPRANTALTPRGRSGRHPVSAISREDTPAPAKADGAADAVVAAPPDAAPVVSAGQF